MTAGEDRNPLRARLRAGADCVGTWAALPSPPALEAVAQAGFDWVCIDWQHGFFGEESLAPLIQTASLAGAAPVVRVPLNDPWLIQKALDLGAAGVVVPLVNSRADAERAAAACRYPPEGVRSFGPLRASAAIGWEPAAANREILCLVQIETADALAGVDAIASTPGVDGLFVGPADLALSLGLPVGAPQVDERLGPVLAAGRRHGVAVGRHCDTVEVARAALASGFTFVATGGDLEFLARGAVACARAARQAARRTPAPLADALVRLLVAEAPESAPAS